MDICNAIRRYNEGREPERLAMKYAAMRGNPFVFLRGTCHLFYARPKLLDSLAKSPSAWLSGDLHLQNFGSYKGDNRLVYFDVNDFDEAALGPVAWDVVRLICSLLVAAPDLAMLDARAVDLGRSMLDAYARSLADGKALWLETETSEGVIRDLLQGLKDRRRVDFLDARTRIKGRRRLFRSDPNKFLPVSEQQRARAIDLVQRFAASQANPDFFKVLDVARRVAGTGSLGVERYAVLVEGKGSPGSNYLLDLKEALGSSLIPRLAKQPRWATEAERIVELQRQGQAMPMAFLHAVGNDERSYLLRGLQPTEDRVDLSKARGDESLAQVLNDMARLAAWSHLRGAGRRGSAIPDELIEFGRAAAGLARLLDVARECAERVRKDWKTYVAAYDDGAFRVDPSTSTSR